MPYWRNHLVRVASSRVSLESERSGLSGGSSSPQVVVRTFGLGPLGDLQILRTLESHPEELALVRRQGHMNAGVRSDVIAFDSGCLAVVPLCECPGSEQEVNGTGRNGVGGRNRTPCGSRSNSLLLKGSRVLAIRMSDV